MKNTTLSLLMAAAVAAPLVASAEDYDSILSDIGLSDAWELSLTVFVDYGDNRDSVPDHYDADVDEKYRYKKEDDVKFGIQPRLTYNGRLSDAQTYALSYSPVYHYWDNPRVGSKKSEVSHMAYAEYKFAADTRNVFTLRDDFKYFLDDRWYLDDNDVARSTAIDKKHVDHAQEHYDNTASAKWDHQVSSRMAFSLKAYWNTIRYDDDDVADMSDEDKYGLRLDVSRATSAQFNYGVFFHYRGWDEKDTAWTSEDGAYRTKKVERGIDTYTVGVAGSYRWDERLTFNASYGWEWVDYESDSIDDRDFPGDLDVSATYAIDLRTRGVLGVRYYVSEAWVYPYASQDLVSLYGTLQHTFSKSVTGRARVEYKTSEYDMKYVPEEARSEKFVYNHSGDKNELWLEVGANYRITQNLNVDLSYSWQDVDSDVSASYSENTVRARATYLF